MDPTWQNFLLAAGAQENQGRIETFGNAPEEIRTAESGTVLADLSHLGTIQFSGEDCETFLQGQVTCDVREATQALAQLGGYCTPKGRLVATFLLWRDETGVIMQLPAELVPGIQKRLGMYVLRSRVRISDASAATVRLGLAGPDAATAIAAAGLPLPQEAREVCRARGVTLIRSGQRRFELLTLPDNAADLWAQLCKHAKPVGSGCWEWLDIRDGIPMVTARTQEQFVPQMVNLELIGGVSFKKGCYTGQEVVARSQYLGKVKRRMYLVNIQADVPPQAGDVLFGHGPEEQSGGMLVNIQASPSGGYDALAVILNTSIEAGDVHWKTADGPVVKIVEEQPYPIG